MQRADRWTKWLIGYTGLFVVFSLWTPLMWFTGSLMAKYHMPSFDPAYLNAFDTTFYVSLAVATFTAQIGFVVVASNQRN